MKLKSASLATRLLLASCVSAVVIVAAIVLFIKLSIIPQLTEKGAGEPDEYAGALLARRAQYAGDVERGNTVTPGKA